MRHVVAALQMAVFIRLQRELVLLLLMMSRLMNTVDYHWDCRCLSSATTFGLFPLSVMVLWLKLRLETDVGRHNSMLLWPSIGGVSAPLALVRCQAAACMVIVTGAAFLFVIDRHTARGRITACIMVVVLVMERGITTTTIIAAAAACEIQIRVGIVI